LTFILSIEESLRKSELLKSELEMEVSRMQAEEANLKHALMKMQSLNDALGHDKNDLKITIVKVTHAIEFVNLSINIYTNTLVGC